MSNDKKIGNAAVDNVIKIPIPDLQSAQEPDTSPTRTSVWLLLFLSSGKDVGIGCHANSRSQKNNCQNDSPDSEAQLAQIAEKGSFCSNPADNLIQAYGAATLQCHLVTLNGFDIIHINVSVSIQIIYGNNVSCIVSA